MPDGNASPSRRSLTIEAIAAFGDEVEIVVVGSPHRNADGDWMVKVLARRFPDCQEAVLSLPIGTLPLLSAGRVFVEGRRIDSARNGLISGLVIPDLSACTEVGSDETPLGLIEALNLPRGLRRGRPQTLLRYDVEGTRVFVPAVELARILYLRHALLAQAVMRPQGLMALCVAPAPGRYQRLELAFTENVPVKVLRGRGGVRFAERFAWIAVDPQARRGWDSILRRTGAGEALRFDPPQLLRAACEVRWVEAGQDALVLEFLSVGGRTHPCDELLFSHPGLVRKVSSKPTSRASEDGSGPDADGLDAEPSGASGAQGAVTTKLTLDQEGRASRSDGAKEGIDSYADEFTDRIPVHAIRPQIAVPEGQGAAAKIHGDEDGADTPIPGKGDQLGSDMAGAGSGIGGAALTQGDGHGNGFGTGSPPDGAAGSDKPKPDTEQPKPRHRKVSVAEPGAGAVLEALEFELLEPMEIDRTDALAPMIEVLKYMDLQLPDVRVASSLTPLRDGRTVSRLGEDRLKRRPALVGILWPHDRPPKVLLEVDHSGGLSLALLALHYGAEPQMRQIETDVRALLDAMVARSGAWNLDVVADRTGKVPLHVERMAKVLRQPGADRMPDYLKAWTVELIERLELVGYMRG
jgi:hypothetical protein